MHFEIKICNWYNTNKRELPFRKESNNPYKVWISEIILQQTKLIQGLPYYIKFINKYPNIQALSSANEHDILKVWQGLGYYSRARNIHATAKYISQKLKGKFPENYKDLLKLKGIGPYTAAAISSISFNEPVIALDGNGYRFLSRYFGIESCIDKADGKKEITEIGQKLIPKTNPGDFNQAIIELGALICKPKKPECLECPVKTDCISFMEGKQELLPIRLKKTKPKIKYLYYLYIKNKNNTILLNKRVGNGIWENLYDFPLIESEKKISVKKVPFTSEWKNIFLENNPIIRKVSGQYKHILSHQILKTHFFEIEIDTFKNINKSFRRVSLANIEKFPVPKLIDKFFQQKELEL